MLACKAPRQPIPNWYWQTNVCQAQVQSSSDAGEGLEQKQRLIKSLEVRQQVTFPRNEHPAAFRMASAEQDEVENPI